MSGQLASDSIFALVQESSALGTAGILVLLVFGLWLPRVGARASAYAALVVGTLSYVIGAHALETEAPYLLSVGLALAAYLLSAPLSRVPRTRAAADPG